MNGVLNHDDFISRTSFRSALLDEDFDDRWKTTVVMTWNGSSCPSLRNGWRHTLGYMPGLMRMLSAAMAPPPRRHGCTIRSISPTCPTATARQSSFDPTPHSTTPERLGVTIEGAHHAHIPHRDGDAETCTEDSALPNHISPLVHQPVTWYKRRLRR